MKAICIEQPWASMICYGVQDTISLPFKPEKNPGRVLIVARQEPVPDDFFDHTPYGISLSMDYFRLSAQMPELEDMPRGAVVGYADIASIDTDSDSIWARKDKGLCHWKLTNGHAFKQPVAWTNFPQGLFDIEDIGKENMPKSRVPVKPKYKGTELFYPINEQTYNTLIAAEEEMEFDITLTDVNMGVFLKNKNARKPEPRDVEVLTLAYEDKTLRYLVEEYGLIVEDDNNGHPFEYKNHLGETRQWLTLAFNLGERIE